MPRTLTQTRRGSTRRASTRPRITKNSSRATGTTRRAPAKKGTSRKAATKKTTAGKGRTVRAVAWDQTPQPDATALLMHDHRGVKRLLKELGQAEAPDERTAIFSQIDRELEIHSRLEEEIFYPAFRDACESAEDRRLFFEAHEEHDSVKVLLGKMRNQDPASDIFAAQAKVLREQVEHHAEEEETDMFPKARRLLGRTAITEVGARMQARRPEVARILDSAETESHPKAGYGYI